MTNLRQAAQQALEALEQVNTSPHLQDCYHAFDGEITALRAALAEQDRLEGIEAIEKDAGIHVSQQAEPECKCTMRQKLVGDGCAVCNPERAKALAEPHTTHWEGCEAVHPECRKQEPDGISWLKRDSGYFTAPTPRKPWVGLTVEEIFDCTHHITRIQQDEWVATDDDLCEFADTVAQVLKKKNGYGTWNKPLSKEQIDNICKSFCLGYTDEELVRAIERAHGIGGQHE